MDNNEFSANITGDLRVEVTDNDKVAQLIESLLPETDLQISAQLSQLESQKNQPTGTESVQDQIDQIINEYPVESYHYYWSKLNPKDKKESPKGKPKNHFQEQLKKLDDILDESIAKGLVYLGMLKEVYSQKSRELSQNQDFPNVAIIQCLIKLIDLRIASSERRITAGSPPGNPQSGSHAMARNNQR